MKFKQIKLVLDGKQMIQVVHHLPISWAQSSGESTLEGAYVFVTIRIGKT